MIKLHKIYIENFKGITDKEVIDFTSSNFTLFCGPNGYGKTTIFDAIELCVRGKLERTTQHQDVTKHNRHYFKPFFQNTVGRDVVVKVLLYDDKKRIFHTLIRFFSKDSTGVPNGGRRFRPDHWELFDVFYISNNDKSFDDVFIASEHQENKVNQEVIDRLFYAEASLQIEKLYPLFSYLQQEENIYFLKKNENEKKEQLNFLFQTEHEEEQFNKIAAFRDNLLIVRNSLEERIVKLSSDIENVRNVDYERIFQNSNLQFDEEKLFDNVDTDVLSEVFTELLRDLEEKKSFVESFSIRDYRKEKLKSELVGFARNKYGLYSFMLQKLIKEKYVEYQNLKIKEGRLNAFLQRKDTYIISREVFQDVNVSDELIERYETLFKNLTDLKKDSDEITNVINSLNESRKETFDLFDMFKEIRQEEGSYCPLCHAEWQTYSMLAEAVKEKTEKLKIYNKEKLDALESIKEAIKIEVIAVVESLVEIYLENTDNIVDDEVWSIMQEVKENRYTTDRLNDISEAQGWEIMRYVLNDKVTKHELDVQFEVFYAELGSLNDRIIIDFEKLNNKHLYQELFHEDETIFSTFPVEKLNNKRVYIVSEYNRRKNHTLEILTNRRIEIDKVLKRLNRISDIVNGAIRQFRLEMIDRIKVPFYIYTGKILQHFQQGLGIFIDVRDSTDKVRFLTSKEDSDHDIIHQLSSGQLAVVSIAFCLALNKVYNTNHHFKFLAIDDPVQTMDDINTHSFIELLRHDFSDYQVLLSTHEEEVSDYMAYKFNSFGISTERINVRNKFYA